MFEARLQQGLLLKKIIEAIKDLVSDANWDCNENSIQLQAMDNSHVALVYLKLEQAGFDPYRCDRNLSLGINIATLSKILKAAGNDDIITLKAMDEGDADTLSLIFESQDQDRIAEYELKLMDIDSEHLGIPETPYDATITLPSSEFSRICKDLSILNESVLIEVTKEGVKFSANGDVGKGMISLKQTTAVDKDEKDQVNIDLQQPVSLNFSLKYLTMFCKAAGLSDQVSLCMSNEVPLLVEYKISDIGYLHYYLAPKLGDE